MSWEIFVQVWLYSVIGFVVGVLLTWLVWVRPLQQRIPKQEPARMAGGGPVQQALMAQPQAPAQQQQAPVQPSAPRQATPIVTAPRTPTVGNRTAPQQPSGTLFTPPKRPIPDEAAEEQTLVFDFGGPNSTSQTRKVDEQEDSEPWRPMLDFDPNDRLSAQLPKRERERESAADAEPDRAGQPGMFEAVVPADDDPLPVRVPSEPAQDEPARQQEPVQDDSAWRPPQGQHADSSSEEYFSFLERTGEPEVAQPAQSPWELNGNSAATAAEEAEEPKHPLAEETSTEKVEPEEQPGGLPRRVPGASGIPTGAPDVAATSSEATSAGSVKPDPVEPVSAKVDSPDAAAKASASLAEPRAEQPAAVAPPNDPVTPTALPASSGSLFDPDHEPPAHSAAVAAGEKKPPMGPFGPGSALPLPDGSAPAKDFTVKARTSSMVFHTKESPFFDRLLPQVWFSDETVATRAGFTSWERPSET